MNAARAGIAATTATLAAQYEAAAAPVLLTLGLATVGESIQTMNDDEEETRSSEARSGPQRPVRPGRREQRKRFTKLLFGAAA
jgi:hypothetical protein